jgi:hypothetical protein
MALKKPAKPKLKKYPKQPKSSASMDAWKNYDAKVKAIDADNNKRVAEYKKRVTAYNNEMKQREAIKNRAAKAKEKLAGF